MPSRSRLRNRTGRGPSFNNINFNRIKYRATGEDLRDSPVTRQLSEQISFASDYKIDYGIAAIAFQQAKKSQ